MAFYKTVQKSLDDTRTAITESLKNSGFGILTEIDVSATIKSKIGVERDPLIILGACNPRLANDALNKDIGFALLMPCNVVLSEDGDGTKISIIDPHDLINDAEMQPLADEAAGLLKTALDKTE
ncbi:MAG: DUF302 domain-containing protein [Actinomycetota bacterium]|nr:MAG: DUF302 domain-containing protein [Actinomycetota bacterium]